MLNPADLAVANRPGLIRPWQIMSIINVGRWALTILSCGKRLGNDD